MVVVAGVVVALAGCALMALGVWSLGAPRSASAFLGRFASSFAAHVIEMALRLVAGAAFVAYAPWMRHAVAFEVFGWVLVVTSLALLALPFRWHQRFARWSVPMVQRRMAFFGLVSLALGGGVLYGAVGGHGVKALIG